ILFRVSATSPSLLDDGKEDVLYKRLTAIDFEFAPIKDAIVNDGFSAILLLTDPPPKIKPIESITGRIIFKPLPMYVPVEVSPYYFMTNLVSESDKTKIYDFCQSVHHMWTSSNKSIAMIIGAKYSGKSTISKELCNILLSTKPHEASTIYYLDCDVGQSEFTPPGLISIVKIDKPILSMFYFPGGDLDLYISILKQCFTEFFEISQHDANALLLINTLGWVENFGKEILDNLVKIFAPGCILALKRGYIHVPSTAGRVFFHDAHIV
uniref:Polyribonucleotide 5'-hydroxyl-kinase Clp1 P-loop domain-containing protein n=1 Tax=Panagrolaimus sp. PS1159 TaxID=55785 RepID=A0AC35F3Z5_9BILA